jgi:prefoldin subunit 5
MKTRKNTFLLKRSNVSGNIPTAGQILLGELALNTSDVILYASGTTTNSILPIGWDRIHRTGDTMTGTLYAPIFSGGTYYGNGSGLTNVPLSPESSRLLINDSSTGVINFDGLSFSPSGTTYNVGNIKGWFIDNYTDPANPTKIYVDFAPTVGNPVTNITTQNSTYVGINSSGVLQQSATQFTPSQRRSIISLGVVIHSNKTFINVVNNTPSVAVNPADQLSDLIRGIGYFNQSGNVYGLNGTNLKINKSSGIIFKEGSGFVVDRKNPHTVSLGGLVATTFRYRTLAGVESAETTDINPNTYDLGGTESAVAGNKFTIQRIALFESNVTRIQYGQNLYNNMSDAISAIEVEPFVVEQNIRENGLLRGLLIVRGGTTDLTDVTRAKFITVSKFGDIGGLGGVSVTTLQQAYNNSINPEITTTPILGSVDFKVGSGSNLDNVLTIQNSTGGTTTSINGNGLLTTNNILSNSISGTTFHGDGFDLDNLNIKVKNIIYVGLELNNIVEFTSLKSAIDSVTGATSSNPYLIKVGPGIYVEDTLTMKEHVYVTGESNLTTTINIDSPTKNLVNAIGNSSISDCFLLGGTDTNKGVINTTTAFGLGKSFYMRNILFGGGDKIINVNVSTGSSIISMSNCGMSLLGTFKTFMDIQGAGSTTVSMANTKLAWSPFVNADNFLHLRGPNNSVSITDFGLLNNGFCTNLFRVNDGSTLNLIGASVDGGNNVIYNENIGVGATIRCANVSIVNSVSDINILHSGTTGFFSGVKDYSKTFINYDNPFYISGEDSRLITVNKKGGNFTSIKDAVDSIISSSETNRYLIDVGPGEFIEDEINLVGKPYVSIKGSSIQSTIVKPTTQIQNIFSIGEYNELSFLWLEGTGVGYAGVSVHDSGDYSQVHKVTVNNCNIGINIISSTQDTIFYGEYLDINGEYDFGIKVTANNGYRAFANLENYYNYPISTGSSVGTYVSGGNSEADVLTSGANSDEDGNDTAFYVENGGKLKISGADISGFGTAFHVGNVGSGSSINIVGTTASDSVNYDLLVEHPNSVGVLQTIFTNSKISINPSASISLTNQDPTESSYSIVGDFKMGDKIDTVTDVTNLIVYGTSYGLYSGGTISANTGLTVNIGGGFGYLEDTVSLYVKYVEWVGVTGLVIPANSTQYIYINDSGVVSISTSLPIFKSNIVLGRVVSDSTNVVSINITPLKGKQYSSDAEGYRRDILKSSFKSGSIVSANASPRKLNVTAGVFYFSNTKLTPTGGSAISFTPIHKSATANQWIFNTNSDTVSNTQYDNGSGTLATIPDGKWVKHGLYVNGSGANEKYFLQYGDVLYDSQILAEAGGLPTEPSFFTEGIVSLASLVVLKSATNIAVIKDERPFLGTGGSSGGGGGSNDHSALINLTADDHLQYLLVDGTRAMSGNLNLNSNQITNAGNINGVSITAHASRHLPNGSDALATGIASTLGTSNAVGTANAFSRQDHVHAHGDQTSGSLHAIATTGVNGFMSSGDKTQIGILYTGGTISGNLRVNTSFANVFSGNTVAAVYHGNGSNLSGIGEVNTASNLGGGNGVFKQKTGANLEMRTLVAGTNTTITPVGDTLVFASTGGGSARTTATVNTTNATLTVLATISTLTDNATNLIDVYIKAYQASAAQWGVWRRTLAVTKVAGTVVIREVNADVDKQSTGLKPNSVTFTVSGGNVNINVTGIAATTITWNTAYERIL